MSPNSSLVAGLDRRDDDRIGEASRYVCSISLVDIAENVACNHITKHAETQLKLTYNLFHRIHTREHFQLRLRFELAIPVHACLTISEI